MNIDVAKITGIDPEDHWSTGTQWARYYEEAGQQREKLVPTLKLLQVCGLDVSTHQVGYVG